MSLQKYFPQLKTDCSVVSAQPAPSSLAEVGLSEKFLKLNFKTKIKIIRSHIEPNPHTVSFLCANFASFTNFQPVIISAVEKSIVSHMHSSSCALDIIHTKLLNKIFTTTSTII